MENIHFVLGVQDTWSWDIVRPTMCSWLHILGDFGKTFQILQRRRSALRNVQINKRKKRYGLGRRPNTQMFTCIFYVISGKLFNTEESKVAKDQSRNGPQTIDNIIPMHTWTTVRNIALIYTDFSTTLFRGVHVLHMPWGKTIPQETC